ncbi:hypothetical protein CBS147346_9914 [Aspergillus niger]|nr:hypothetical protein CBS147346_9914 [Aspergillus niger]
MHHASAPSQPLLLDLQFLLTSDEISNTPNSSSVLVVVLAGFSPTLHRHLDGVTLNTEFEPTIRPRCFAQS